MKKIKMLLSLMTVVTYISEAHADNRCLDHINQRITNNSLNLSKCGLQDKDMPRILDFLASHKNISDLDLSWNQIYDHGLIMLAANNTLQSLNLNANSYNKINMKTMAAFAKNTALNTLIIGGLSNEGAILLAKTNTLTQLKAKNNNIGPSGAVALAQNTSLTVLDISYSYAGIGDEGAAAFAKNTHLQSLNVMDNKISNAGLLLLAANPTISELTIGGGDPKIDLSIPVLNALAENPHLKSFSTYNIGGDSGATILAKSKSLEEVNLKYGNISDEGALAIASNPKITKLDLSWNHIGPKGVVALANMPALTRLDLSANNYYSTLNIAGAEALAKSKTLTELWLNDCGIDDRAAAAVAKSQSIKKLMLRYNKISDEGAIAFANNSMLTELDIGGGENSIGTKGIQALAHNTHLEKLDLSHSIGVIDAAAFTALADNMTLIELDLSNNQISDKAILKFAASTHIRDLILWRNMLGDASAIAFATNTNINNLDVAQNLIGEKGVQTLLASSIVYLDVQSQGQTQ
jgi:Ran GTPase-activating protein (RanGAP) involved in mRNA processing and transport